MSSEFQQISALITNLVLLEKATGPDKSKLYELRQMVDVQFNDLLNRIEAQIFEQENQERLSIFIHLVQIRFTSLTDCLYQSSLHFNLKSPEFPDLNEVVITIHKRIIGVLDYLHSHFSASFDTSEKLPGYFFFLPEHDIEDTVQTVEQLSTKNIDLNLISIIRDYLNSSATGKSSVILTWQQWDYLKEAFRQIKVFSELPAEEDDNINFIRLLIRINFNSLAFYDFMLDYTESQISKESIYEGRETALILLLKTIEDILPESKNRFNVNLPDIKDSIADAMRRNLKRIVQLKDVYKQDLVNGDGVSKDVLFEIDGTLEELFFLLRVLIDLGHIKMKFKTLLYAFVSRHVKTIHTEIPSVRYMRNIFSPSNRVSQKIVRKAKHRLQAVLKYIDVNFPERF